VNDVIDYPLFTSISRSERNSILNILGIIETLRLYGDQILDTPGIVGYLAELLEPKKQSLFQKQAVQIKLYNIQSTSLLTVGQQRPSPSSMRS